MFVTVILRSLLKNARISAWMLVTLAGCAILVTLFATAALEVGRTLSATLRKVGANAVAYPAANDSPANWNSLGHLAPAYATDFALLHVKVGLVDGCAVAIVGSNRMPLDRLTPYWAVTGRRAEGPGECTMGRRVADSLGLRLLQQIRIEWPDGAPASQFTITGLIECGDEDEDRVFIPVPFEQAEFHYALLAAADGESGIERLAQALTGAGSGIMVKPLRQVLQGEEHVLDKVNLLCIVALAAVLSLTALGVCASMLARVMERRKEFALMQALGASRYSVAGILLAESATLGIAGAAAGFGVGSFLAAVVLRQIFQTSITPHVSAGIAALIITTLVALLAGGVAAMRVTRFQPAIALRGE